MYTEKFRKETSEKILAEIVKIAETKGVDFFSLNKETRSLLIEAYRKGALMSLKFLKDSE